ncbi:MAG: glycine zipper 2TM domain-containing protein [Sulfitobacter sp.]|nr:glycine zipper 2TM domain-containing protein [Sulfitobacter sp.]
MKKFLIALPMVAALGACATPEQNTAAGALAGAAIGATVADDDVTGAVIGGAAGAIAGNYLGRTSSGACVYARADGSRYTAACP